MALASLGRMAASALLLGAVTLTAGCVMVPGVGPVFGPPVVFEPAPVVYGPPPLVVAPRRVIVVPRRVVVHPDHPHRAHWMVH